VKESKEKRSQIMRAVKGKNTAPELLVRKLIFSLGFRYRLHGSHLPGNPDIFFPKKKKAIFIHGCFWHGHSCKRGNRIPATNNAYWQNKIEKNKLRDKKNLTLLSETGWSTLVIWECDLKNTSTLTNSILAFIAT
jgi:DNA mismatch endonuclease (patch repair protein)